MDVIPSAALDYIDWYPDLMQFDTANHSIMDHLYRAALPVHKSNAFKGAIQRTVGDQTYKSRYEQLNRLGNQLIQEIKIII